MPDSFEDDSIYKAQPPQNAFDSHTSNLSIKKSQNAMNLNNLIMDGHSGNISKHEYVKSFQGNVQNPPQFQSKLSSNNSN